MERTCLNRRGEAGRRYVCFTTGVECYYRWGWGKKAMILLFGVVLLFLNSFKLASGEYKIPFAGTIFYSTPPSSIYAFTMQLVKEHQWHRYVTSQHTLTLTLTPSSV